MDKLDAAITNVALIAERIADDTSDLPEDSPLFFVDGKLIRELRAAIQVWSEESMALAASMLVGGDA